jgi:hypothetical protein
MDVRMMGVIVLVDQEGLFAEAYSVHVVECKPLKYVGGQVLARRKVEGNMKRVSRRTLIALVKLLEAAKLFGKVEVSDIAAKA